MQTNAAPTSAVGRPRDRVSLALATFLSLLLHVFIAGGLVTTGLGIIATPDTDSTAVVRNIFKPKLAVDFPLEVSRSTAAAGAHENPLDLASPRRQQRAAPPRVADSERHVSQKAAPEQPQESAATSQLPLRPVQSPDERLDAARQLERAELRQTEATTERAAMPTITASTDDAPPPAAPSRRQPAPRQADPTTSAPRAPREVAILANTMRNRAAASRPADAMTLNGPVPRTADLARQTPTTTAPAATSATAEAIASVAPAESEAAPLRARPRAEPASPPSPSREREGSFAKRPGEEHEPADVIASAPRPTDSASGARGTRADAAASPSVAVGRSGPARAGVATTIAEAAGAAVAVPAAVAGTGNGDAATGEASVARPRPGPSSGGGQRREASRGVFADGPAGGGIDRGNVGGDGASSEPGEASAGGGGASSSSQALASIGRRPSQGDGSAEGEWTAAIGTAPSTPARAGVVVDGVGEAEGGIASAADAQIAASSAASPRPMAPSFRGGVVRGSGGGPRSAVARGGSPGGIIAESIAETDSDDGDEGLSQDGSAAVLDSLARASSSRRGAQEEAAASQASALPRVTAFTLPVEERVRDIAVPFMNRLREKRTSRETDAIVDRGLDFLKRSQQDDGRWKLSAYPGADRDTAPKLSSDTAATGLALLAFLGAGHDHFDGPHRDTVRRGLEFLITAQQDDGDLYLPADPLSNSCAWLYSHGIATMALCEAVGMTGDPRIRPAAERACRFISTAQHPERGGWRYTPRSDADLSVSGWMLVALRSGELAGVAVDRKTMPRVTSLLEASTIPPSAARSPLARFHYNARKPEQRPSELSTACMNALGTLMRLHTGWAATDSRVVANAETLAAMRPTYGEPSEKSRDCYLWYYASQVLVHVGGEPWDAWYAALADTLGPRQTREGPAAGSWDPLGATPDRWGQYGGRIYVTALHLLTLEVPYRHLPTYSFGNDTR